MATSALCILVAEDQGFQRKAVVHMLNSMGIKEVWQANNGREALEMLHPSPAIEFRQLK